MEAEDVTKNIREFWVQICINKRAEQDYFQTKINFLTKLDYLQLNDCIYLPSLHLI